MRYFNPPPNWPPAPPGWSPDSEWSPDPSWPPAPPDWQFWVDDPALAPAQAQAQAGPGFAPQWAPQPPSGSNRRKALWIALAVGAAVVLVVGLVFGLGVGRHALNSADGKSRKPAITELSRDLLVDRSAFPDTDIAKRSSGVGADDGKASALSKLSIDPEECADFYGLTKSATQMAYASVAQAGSNGPRSLEVHLALTRDRTNLKDALGKCQAFTVSLDVVGRTVTMDAKLEPLDVPGVPSWAVAAAVKSSSTPFPGIPITIRATTATISGYYRDVLVVAACNKLSRGKDSASIDTGDVDDLTKLFNAQIKQLEAAP